VKKIEVTLTSGKNEGYFGRTRMYIYDHISLSSSEDENFFQTKVVEKIQTHILCSITLFRKPHHL